MYGQVVEDTRLIDVSGWSILHKKRIYYKRISGKEIKRTHLDTTERLQEEPELWFKNLFVWLIHVLEMFHVCTTLLNWFVHISDYWLFALSNNSIYFTGPYRCLSIYIQEFTHQSNRILICFVYVYNCEPIKVVKTASILSTFFLKLATAEYFYIVFNSFLKAINVVRMY